MWFPMQEPCLKYLAMESTRFNSLTSTHQAAFKCRDAKHSSDEFSSSFYNSLVINLSTELK